jgi:glycosyltransferase involved in cell wall biosynthesis
VPYVRKLLRQIRPDLLLAYYVTGYGTLAALTGFHPIVQVTSGSDVLVTPANQLMRILLRHVLSRADLVTAWAPHMASAARELGVPENRLLVLPRGIPHEQFTAARNLERALTDAIAIVSTRSLKSNYKIDVLLEAISILQRRGRHCFVTVVGDGPERESLVARVGRLGLEKHVRFTGFVPNRELPGVLANSNLYISLIETDGVSASLLEAMASGILPIVPDHPANRFWITPGENGILLTDLSPPSIAEAIVSASQNRSLRRRAWEQNFETVQNRADLYRNSEVFLRIFAALAGSAQKHHLTRTDLDVGGIAEHRQ